MLANRVFQMSMKFSLVTFPCTKSLARIERQPLTERSPALSSEENLSDVSNIPFVTIPHGKPRAVISLPTDSRSLRRSGSPPVMQIITVCGSTCCFISSSAFKKSDGSMSGIDASFLQSLPQWRQFRLQRKVHSQK